MLRNLEIVPATESWSELLEWVNRSMPVEAPNHNKAPAIQRVEDCGHGVPYVLMLPTMLPIIHTPLLTSRVKVPAKTDYEAVANLKIMQDALQRNGIIIPDVLANGQQKLIGRNFQANLRLLQWFRGLYVALKQCGIEAGEGRIVLAAPNAEDSIPSLGSLPDSVVRAEDRRRAESMHQSNVDSEMLREVRAAGSQGDAAAAAAVAILSEQRSRSRLRSQSRNSQLEASVLSSSCSASLPVHHQQVPKKTQQRPVQPQHESASRSRREEPEPQNYVLPKPAERSSPRAAPPATEPRATPLPPPPQPVTKQMKKPAAPAQTPSQTRKSAEHPTSVVQRKQVRPPSPAAVPPPSAPIEMHVNDAEIAKPVAAANMALHRRSSVPAGTTAGDSTNRAPRRADSSASTAGRSSFVFKPVPARLSVSANGRRRISERSGGTPRAAETVRSSTPNAVGSRTGSTPKRTASHSDRGSALQGNGIAAVRQPASRPMKPAAKPIIAIITPVPALAQSQSKAQPAAADRAAVKSAAPSSLTASNDGSSSNNNNDRSTAEPPATTAALATGQSTKVDVLQLQIDRQFYYDKLRSIEELVDCMEAKKKQERKAKAASWDSKDEEMMDFTKSVRSVLYAES